MKDTLWDMLITMPPPFSSAARDKAWPTVECPRGSPLKATQRDLRRYLALRAGLVSLTAPPTAMAAPSESPRSETSTAFRLSSRSITAVAGDDSDESLDKIVEPPSWAALAYNGFMWWASAGEQRRSDEQEEATRDAALLADLSPAAHTPSMSMPTPMSRSTALAGMTDSVSSLTARRSGPDDDEARTELAIITYFHRFTTQILSNMSELVDNADDSYEDDDDMEDSDPAGLEDVLLQNNGENEGRTVRVDSRAIENMGLDIWNPADAEFVKEIMIKYFDRKAYIEGKGVEVCGVRVC
jgi:hypothetical protein